MINHRSDAKTILPLHTTSTIEVVQGAVVSVCGQGARVCVHKKRVLYLEDPTTRRGRRGVYLTRVSSLDSILANPERLCHLFRQSNCLNTSVSKNGRRSRGRRSKSVVHSTEVGKEQCHRTSDAKNQVPLTKLKKEAAELQKKRGNFAAPQSGMRRRGLTQRLWHNILSKRCKAEERHTWPREGGKSITSALFLHS